MQSPWRCSDGPLEGGKIRRPFLGQKVSALVHVLKGLIFSWTQIDGTLEISLWSVLSCILSSRFRGLMAILVSSQLWKVVPFLYLIHSVYITYGVYCVSGDILDAGNMTYTVFYRPCHPMG